ncbi:MAG TPA: EFR1 family ferrodoxin [Candidatus Faecivivens stercorigallinarum]|nr:EFR1 family ferrodoxin [Candidatus Faecivivens stercorigallinarum]
MIIYFSATGNSRYAAQMLADQLNEPVTDAGAWIKNNQKGEFYSETPWIFVSPTYSWQMPHIFADFIRQTRFLDNQDAYFILTCGGETGYADQQIEALCKEKGLHFRGVWPTIMPDNYIIMFPAPDPNKSRQILTKATDSLTQAASIIRDRQDFPALSHNWLDRIKSGIINQGFYRFQIKTAPFHATNSCISCGKCVRVCPLNNIHMKNGRPVWGNNCTHCTACLNGCPSVAIEYGKKTRGKNRYQCPEYQKQGKGSAGKG